VYGSLAFSPSSVNPGASPEGNFGGSFTTTYRVDAGVPCGRVQIGSCIASLEFSICPDASAAPLTPALSAGALTIWGPAFGTVDTSFEPDGGGYGYSPTFDAGAPAPIFVGGDALCVTGSGADVPEFPALPIVAPALPQMTSPTFLATYDGGTVPFPSISVEHDFVVSRVPTSPGARIIVVLPPGISCVFDGEAGTDTIPKAALDTVRDSPQIAWWRVERIVVYGSESSTISVSALAGTYLGTIEFR
jgi:hypothetical protein